jgi:thiamine pyrophosphate-dependent acetolactate synthase large subunit-like protein
MDVASLTGSVLGSLGVTHVFGVVGSGNFHITNALIAAGATFVPAAHEAGAITAADAYARLTGRVGVVSVHQGPGVTNALTGLAEAAKSHTPLLLLAPEATNPLSNFAIDLPAVAAGVGAAFHRLSASTPVEDALSAWQQALRGTVVLGLPLDIQGAAVGLPSSVDLPFIGPPAIPDVDELVAALHEARRPVFIAGRGAARVPWSGRRAALEEVADRCGALLATSAAAKGLFAGSQWDLDVSGGFASPLATSLIESADLIVAWGSTLNMWTTRHGRLIPPDATVVRIDHDPVVLSRPLNTPAAVVVDVCGDVGAVVSAVLAALPPSNDHWRTPDLAARIAASVRWRDVPFDDESTSSLIDPRTLTIALDDLLPAERVVAVDSGNFMGYPSMFLRVPDVCGFSFTQAYQSIGLGLASAIGAHFARPDRLVVAALGDGGFLMSAAELTTVARLSLPLVIIVYNDAAYGAEVHHFGSSAKLDTVRFPDSDIASIARGFGLSGVTVRSVADLEPAREWLAGPRDQALVIDAKVSSERASWWLEEAFRGH